MRDVAAATAGRQTRPGATAAGAPALTGGVLRRPAWSWTWGLAAAAVLVLAVLVLTRQATLQRRLDESVATQAALQRDLAEAQESARRLREEALANGAPTRWRGWPGTDAGPIVALTLAPGLLRDGVPPLTTIPRGALLVRAELVLPPTAAVSYRVALTTAAGRERWSQDEMTATVRAGQRVLRVDVPVTALPLGRLSLPSAADRRTVRQFLWRSSTFALRSGLNPTDVHMP